MDLVLEVEQGGHDKLDWAEPNTLKDAIESLENGTSPLYQMLKPK